MPSSDRSTVPAGAWKTHNSAVAAARKLLGPWFMTLDMCLELAQFADIPEARSLETLEALKRSAEFVEQAHEAAKAAGAAAALVGVAVRGALTREELNNFRERLRIMVAATADAYSLTAPLAGRARNTLLAQSSGQRARRSQRPRRLTPTERREFKNRPNDVPEVSIQRFVGAVLEKHPDAPQDPSAWAYFGIVAGLTRQPRDRTDWKRLKAQWSTALRRARPGRRGAPRG